MADVPILESRRLRLRGHEADDFPDVAALWADPDVVRFISGVPSTGTESWSRLLRYAGMWQLIGYGYWVVESREDGRFLGEVGFADFRRGLNSSIDGAPEAGWVIKSGESGLGYASEAVKTILVWADEVAEFPYTMCLFDPEHKASIHVARKTGYSEYSQVEFNGVPALLMLRERLTCT